jgi:hypothetical protein
MRRGVRVPEKRSREKEQEDQRNKRTREGI